MCKLFKTFSLALAVLMSVAMIIPVEAAKKNMAVMPTYTSSTAVQTNNEMIVYKLVAENMTNQLIMALHNSGNYIVVEREEVYNKLEKLGFQEGKAVDQEQAMFVGKQLEADYSIIGKVISASIINNEEQKTLQDIKNRVNQTVLDDEGDNPSETESSEEVVIDNLRNAKFQGQIMIDLKLINNETGKVVFSDEINSSQSGNNGANALRAACKSVSEDFISQIDKLIQSEQKPQPVQEIPPVQQTPKEPKIPLQQSSSDIVVIDVDNDIVYIDKGIEIGLQENDVLNVVKKEPVKNMSGQIITYKSAIIGKLEVQTVDNNFSICKIIEQNTPSSVKRGCIAEKVSD